MRNLILAPALTLLWACGDFSQPVRTTSLTLTPSTTTPSVGQIVEFRYEAEGRSLAGLIIDYGDGSKPDSTYLSGAYMARETCAVPSERCFRHSYGQAGSFIVSGRLEELFGGSVEEVIPMTVSAAPE
jgi:hypothetical protein